MNKRRKILAGVGAAAALAAGSIALSSGAPAQALSSPSGAHLAYMSPTDCYAHGYRIINIAEHDSYAGWDLLCAGKLPKLSPRPLANTTTVEACYYYSQNYGFGTGTGYVTINTDRTISLWCQGTFDYEDGWAAAR